MPLMMTKFQKDRLAAEARFKAELARARVQERKALTRLKIVLGGSLLALARRDPARGWPLVQLLRASHMSARDSDMVGSLLELDPVPRKDDPKPPLDGSDEPGAPDDEDAPDLEEGRPPE